MQLTVRRVLPSAFRCRPNRTLRTLIPLAVVLHACGILQSPAPVPAAPTLPPAWTATPSPTEAAPPPSSTPTLPPPTLPSCDLEEALRQAKAAISYDQFAVQFTDIAGTASLGIWYVNPELDPLPSAEELQAQMQQARVSAAEVSARVNAAVSCSPRPYDVINPIVVDRRYQGWLSAQIEPAHLPPGPEFTEEQIASAAERFFVGYARTALEHPYVAGACDWPDARERLQSHFSLDRENVAFYFVIDDLGSHVWVQWDGSADPIMSTVNIGNVLLALECFSPNADIIYVIVDDHGVAQQMGVVPQGDTSRLTIVYP